MPVLHVLASRKFHRWDPHPSNVEREQPPLCRSSAFGSAVRRHSLPGGGEDGGEVAVDRSMGRHGGDAARDEGPDSGAHDNPTDLADFAKLHSDIEAWHAEVLHSCVIAANPLHKPSPQCVQCHS